MSTTTPAPPAAARPLVRPRTGAIAGVCGALAEHLGWPLRLTRWVMIALTLFGGAGGLLYLWLWAFTPLAPAASDDPTQPPTGMRRGLPASAILLGGAGAASLVAVVATFSAGMRTAAERPPLVPGAWETALLAAAAIAWSLTLDRTDPGRGPAYLGVVRVGTSALLLCLGLFLLLTGPGPGTAVAAVAMLVGGAIVMVLPRLVTLWSELLEERSARAWDEKRAEIAAHLHDSVLQSLALIQNRAGPGTEVARIARAQERELRTWLFDGDSPAIDDLATAVRDVAAELELEYAVRIDVVATGESSGHNDQRVQAVVAATREAMLNAARHAGGDVSVYLETTPEAMDVFVRDRGPGIVMDELPEYRLGIRESIIGRIARAGGTATVRRGTAEPQPGTEVHIRVEASHD